MNAPVGFDRRQDAYATPIEQIDVSNPHLYQDDTWRPYFERLRRERSGALVPIRQSTGRFGRSRATTTSWRWTPITGRFPPTR